MQSDIEKRLLDRDFAYLRPWFYQNPHALRCELGQGDDSETYMHNAYRRAKEIFAILVPDGQPDAVIFDQYVYETPYRSRYAHKERAFFTRMTVRRHVIVPNLRTHEDGEPEEEKTYTRNRVVSYRDTEDFPVHRLIRRCIWEQQLAPVGFVSFENDPVHHQLPEFTQTHVHRVGDAIRPSHALLSPSPPACWL